jgi:hypothetical protein
MLIYQVNVAVWLGEQSRHERRPVTLDSISPSILDELADHGFHWLWLVGLWEGGDAAREILSRLSPLLEQFQADLPDLEREDIVGSPFVAKEFRVRGDLGGEDALEGLRADLARRDLRLLLDFAPNQVSVDHSLIEQSPDFFIHGSAGDMEFDGQKYFRAAEDRILAHGMDFQERPLAETAQPNFRHAGLRDGMLRELEKVAALADGVGVRAPDDLGPERFSACWGDRSLPRDGSSPVDRFFWAEGIARVRATQPRFVFLAEPRGEASSLLLEAGFDYTWSPRQYDPRLPCDATGFPEHFLAECREEARGEGGHKVRYLERDGDPRAAAWLSPETHPCAAIVSYLPPGVRLFRDGQLQGRRLPQNPYLARRCDEPLDRDWMAFYVRFLEILTRPEVESGSCELLPLSEAWEGNSTWTQFFVLLHTGSAGERLLSAVNCGPLRAQCYADVSGLGPTGGRWTFQDLFSVDVHTREGEELARRGLYLDLGPWDYNVFEVRGN